MTATLSPSCTFRQVRTAFSAPAASAGNWRPTGSLRAGDCELVEQRTDPRVDSVSNSTNGLEILACRVVQLPVLVTFAGVDGAGVSAAHRDHDIGGLDELIGERLWKLLADVDSDLPHRLDDNWVELMCRGAPRRAHADPSFSALVEKPRRHLAAAGVVHADEEHLRDGLGYGSLDETVHCP